MATRKLGGLRFAAAFSVGVAFASALSIVPRPLNQTSDGQLISLDIHKFDFAATGKDSALLQAAFKRYSALLAHGRRGLTSASLADQRSLDWLRSSSLLSAEEHASLTARVKTNAGKLPAAATAAIVGADVAVAGDDKVKTLVTDESYTLLVAAPRIRIEAATVYGAIYALESLSQLMDTEEGSINSTNIYDKPRFAYRATMIDTARHWYPLPAIKQHLDAMSTVKMNVLHWHVVDSQSFPFVSEHLPVLSATGSWQADHVYTARDIAGIVKYANERGIRVIPEFDTPGHVAAGWQSLGVLTDCHDDATGKFTHKGPLNPTLNRTFEVLTQLWADVFAAFAPEKVVHIGGDEVWHTPTHSCWQSNSQVQAWLKAHPEVPGFTGLEVLFERKLLAILHSAGASVIIWQEIFDNGAKPAPDTVINVWKSAANHNPGTTYQAEMAAVTKAGYHAVLSAPYYLNFITYGMDWWAYYQIDPANFTGGDAAEASKLIAGIEACYWSEYIDATNLIARAWPRTAAIAERAWSAKHVRDGIDAQARLHELRCKLLVRGIDAEPIGICSNPGCTANSSINHFPGAAGYCPHEWVPAYTGF